MGIYLMFRKEKLNNKDHENIARMIIQKDRNYLRGSFKKNKQKTVNVIYKRIEDIYTKKTKCYCLELRDEIITVIMPFISLQGFMIDDKRNKQKFKEYNIKDYKKALETIEAFIYGDNESELFNEYLEGMKKEYEERV